MVKFPFGKNIGKMFVNGWYSNIKQLSHRFLRSPYRFIFIKYLNTFLFPRRHKSQELHRTVSYFKLIIHNKTNLTKSYKSL